MANELQGVAELSRQLRGMREGVRGRILSRSVRLAMAYVEGRAQGTIPKGTVAHKVYKKASHEDGGRLVAPGFASRNLRIITKISRDRQATYAVLGVRKLAFYAVQFLERGTSKMAARPWLVPALKQSQGAALGILRDEMAAAILRAARRGR